MTTNNFSKLKDLRPNAVLRIRDVDFRVQSVNRGQGLIRLKLEAADGDHGTLIGTPTARVSQILPAQAPYPGAIAGTTEGTVTAH